MVLVTRISISTFSLLIQLPLRDPANLIQMSISLLLSPLVPNLWRDSSGLSIVIVPSIVVVLMCHNGVTALVAFVVLASVVVSALGVGVNSILRGTMAFALVQHVVLV